MKNYMEYKGYRGSVLYSEEDGILYGKIMGINDSVSYDGDSIDTLTADFHAAVDDYLDFCKETGKTPEKEFKGSFNVRIEPDHHRKAYFAAQEEGVSLNKWVDEAIAQRLAATAQ